MSNEVFKSVKQRIKHAAKLEKLIEENADYDEILKESKKIDKLIIDELRIIFTKIIIQLNVYYLKYREMCPKITKVKYFSWQTVVKYV